jgi:hypothetical protein
MRRGPHRQGGAVRVDPHRAQFRRDHRGAGRIIAAPPQSIRRRLLSSGGSPLLPMGRAQPLDPAAFLIDQDRRIAPHGVAQVAVRRRKLVGRLDVAGKEDEAEGSASRKKARSSGRSGPAQPKIAAPRPRRSSLRHRNAGRVLRDKGRAEPARVVSPVKAGGAQPKKVRPPLSAGCRTTTLAGHQSPNHPAAGPIPPAPRPRVIGAELHQPRAGGSSRGQPRSGPQYPAGHGGGLGRSGLGSEGRDLGRGDGDRPLGRGSAARSSSTDLAMLCGRVPWPGDPRSGPARQPSPCPQATTPEPRQLPHRRQARSGWRFRSGGAASASRRPPVQPRPEQRQAAQAGPGRDRRPVLLGQFKRTRGQHQPLGQRGGKALSRHVVDGQSLMIGNLATGIDGRDPHRAVQRLDHRHAVHVAHGQLVAPDAQPTTSASEHSAPPIRRYRRRSCADRACPRLARRHPR